MVKRILKEDGYISRARGPLFRYPRTRATPNEGLMEAQLPRVSFSSQTELTRQYPVKVHSYAYCLLAMLHFEADSK